MSAHYFSKAATQLSSNSTVDFLNNHPKAARPNSSKLNASNQYTDPSLASTRERYTRDKEWVGRLRSSRSACVGVSGACLLVATPRCRLLQLILGSSPRTDEEVSHSCETPESSPPVGSHQHRIGDSIPTASHHYHHPQPRRHRPCLMRRPSARPPSSPLLARLPTSPPLPQWAAAATEGQCLGRPQEQRVL
jgi:hypothetical protein